ncbi:Tripeptidyl-peptidase [Aspergillus sp. HF37]|nr:Tripeptidyl-peptidase [Aspergillus sp. HF37]
MIAHWLLLTITAASATVARAHAVQDEYQVVEHLDAVPRGWVRESSALPPQMMLFRIAPRLERVGEFHRMVTDLSTPGRPTYGQSGRCNPLMAGVRGVPASTIEDTGNWIKFTVPISHAERMMQTRFYNFQHIDSGLNRIRTLGYSVPQSIAPYVETIQPTTFFSQPRLLSNQADDRPTRGGPFAQWDCNRGIIPSCLRRLYNFVGYEPSPDVGNSIAVTGFLEQYVNIQDLQTFYSFFRPEAMNSSFQFISINGGKNLQSPSKAGREAALDTQYAFSLTHPIQATFYSTAGRPPFHPGPDTPTNTNEPYADFLDYVLSHDNPPLVISTSYGEPEQTVPRAYAERVCTQFAQLGARGVSLLFASGDEGVGETCLTNDGRNATTFKPVFPASCPFVTSVGATHRIPEQAVELSGGGFSDYFSRPAYQEEAVGSYVRGIPPGQWSGLFNRNGRGIPDVAAQGVLYAIVMDGRLVPISGTSASTPTVAVVVALLNDARLRGGMSPLGFLNPLFYGKAKSGLNDIVGGSSKGCLHQDIIPPAGWNVTEGWDPVTGLGTPDFARLRDLVS